MEQMDLDVKVPLGSIQSMLMPLGTMPAPTMVPVPAMSIQTVHGAAMAPVQTMHVQTMAGQAIAPAPENLTVSPLERGTGPFIIKRRSPIACRRCRRMRTKCLHDKGKTPCHACLEAGLGEADCSFPPRGQPDQDRDYRHPRVKADKIAKRDPVTVRREILNAAVQSVQSVQSPLPPAPVVKQAQGVDDWDLLPPLPEIIEAVNKFTRHYFQLGFIPKRQFPERLRTNPRSVSVFFLLGVLSVSARLTPSLIQRYGGGGVNVAEIFMERATSVALTELYKEPDLETCQAFYLLSIAQQGSGIKDQSSVNMAIAVRMATLMQLHREETYVLVNPTEELIIRAESARRTLWMLHSQDNLHSGPHSPVSLSPGDITTLLPCNEDDFANAREPKSRAALEDTPPALKSPYLVADAGRSLFATLIQAHHYWGAISRRAIKYDRSERPWEDTSEFAKMSKRLASWEDGLENDHRWSIFLLKGYKQEGQDLGYLGVTMITRLCNIVIRKAYLHEMMAPTNSNPEMAVFWTRMSRELFLNVADLYEQIDAQYADRSPEEGIGTQMAAFCVYTCGFLSCYLCKHPNLCPDAFITREGPKMVRRILNILDECKTMWPLASRWYDHLDKFYNSKAAVVAAETEGSMADSRKPIHHVLDPVVNEPPRPVHPPIMPPSPEGERKTPLNPANMPQRGQGIDPIMYIDPSLRLPVPQQSPQPSQPMSPSPATSRYGVGMVSPHQHQHQHHHQHHHQQHMSPTGRHQSTNGLGLLIEAFDTQQTGGSNMVSPPTTTTTPGATVPASTPYDPHVAAAAVVAAIAGQGYYHPHSPGAAPGLAINDGYENELGYYMSHPGGVTSMPNWALPGGGMYGAY